LETEVKKKFTPKKQQSVLLAKSYRRLHWSGRADRVADCGSWLEFLKRSGADTAGTVPDASGARPDGSTVRPAFKLYHANFCRERLCPMCSWRRSYKIYGQMSQIMNFLGDKYRYIFLTLTVPNCEPDELDGLIDDMMSAWHRLVNRKRFVVSVKGFFRALEVTRNKKDGTYHPHFHVVLAVDPHYFKDERYIKRDEWLQLWQQSMKDPTITQVDVRVMRNKKTGETLGEALASAVAECTKYAVKSADYVFDGDKKLMDSIVLTLSSALSHRRLTALGGVFQEAQKQLGLDDPEDGDLIHIDDDNIREDLATMIIRYEWSAGAYKLVKKTQLEIIDGISVNPNTGEVIP
jgi:plasmid rolling circle replication initiator protein Rep